MFLVEGPRPDLKYIGGSLMPVPSLQTLVLKARAWGEYERGMAPSRKGGTGGVSLGKI